MATKTFKEICVEYAHQLGKGLPLTPAEMCNAVIMYLNAQITEMQGITTALQTAVSEAESSATEAINKADDISETVNALPKVPTPTTSDNGKVIGVQSGAYALVEQSGGEAPANMVTTDTGQSISGVKFFLRTALRSGTPDKYTIYGLGVISNCDNVGVCNIINFADKSGVIAVESDIPDLDNYSGYINVINGTAGSGIAVHDTVNASPYTKYGYDKIETYGNSNSLRYTLNIPNKNGTIATLDDIPSYTEFSGVVYTPENGAEISYGNNKINLPIIAGDNVTIDADSSDSHIVIGLSKNIPVLGSNNNLDFNLAEDYDGCAIVIRKENNYQRICISNSAIYFYTNNNYTSIYRTPGVQENFALRLPNRTGTIACVEEIPDLDNYTGTLHIVQGTAGSGIAVHDTVNASPYTKYGYDKIETYGNSNSLRYTLNIPNKNGTIATLDDISSAPSSDKYFTRVIYHSIDEDTQYIIFSCITDTDLSANTSHQDVVDLLNSLGANTHDTALPCSGKTVSGGILVGVYSDGSNIIVFDTDNATEELNMSAEFKFISK